MGVTAYHLRILCENPWNGGGGYTLDQIGQMTLDQIWFRLCEMKLLKNKVGKRSDKMDRTTAISTLQPDEDGLIKGRSADGTPIRGRIRGKSLARQLMEEAEERKLLEGMSPRERRSYRRSQRRKAREEVKDGT